MGDFGSAVDALERWAESPEGLAALFVGVFPVTGASVSTVGDILGSETLSASDERAVRIDELQFDLGEGPCWDALRTARPVIMPDLRRDAPAAWPAFSAAVMREELSSIFAFPMSVGPLRLGAVDLYSLSPVRLNPAQTSQAEVMADLIGKQVLRRALDAVGQHDDDVGNAYSRRFVHQATGVVLAQLGLSPEEARLVIQGHAYAESRTMIDVAQDIVEGRLTFTHGPSGIEAS